VTTSVYKAPRETLTDIYHEIGDDGAKLLRMLANSLRYNQRTRGYGCIPLLEEEEEHDIG
jgi:hypothetical protein